MSGQALLTASLELYIDSQPWKNMSWVIASSRPHHKDYFLTLFLLLSYPI